MIAFTVPGKPLGKGRSRFAHTGSFMRAYTPKETADYENRVRLYFSQAAPKHVLLTGPVHVSIWCYFDIPKAWSKKKIADVDGLHWHHIKKPDCDNLIKICLDALNGIAWHDDSQVYSVACIKGYTLTPQMTVQIKGV
jgi:Holliday junction resolvase RusA-like endonuclease